MSVPEEVSRLIEKFDRHLESYRSGKYNEAQLGEVRQRHIDVIDKQIDQLAYQFYFIECSSPRHSLIPRIRSWAVLIAASASRSDVLFPEL